MKEIKMAEKLEEPQIKEGQMIWVRMRSINVWGHGKVVDVTNTEPRVSTIAGSWKFDEYSVLNPYPDSIEARAIEIIRRVKIDRWLEVEGMMDEFLKEIENYKI